MLQERRIQILNMHQQKKIPSTRKNRGGLCCEEWNHCLVVGMMLYLAGSTRPDIVYAVHQYAQFSHAPTRSHEIGLKYIAQYLKGARTKGLVMKPDLKNLQLDLFADAGFAGIYFTEDKQDPINVNS